MNKRKEGNRVTKFEELERAIRAQQKGKEGTDVFVAGEQILDICRGREDAAEIVLMDLADKQMALEKAVEGIRALANSRKKGNFSYVSPAEAEEILRKFYGIPEKNAAPQRGRIVDLADFF